MPYPPRSDEFDAYTRAIQNSMGAIQRYSDYGSAEGKIRPATTPVDYSGGTGKPIPEGLVQQIPTDNSMVVDPTARAPRVQPGPIGGYGNEGRGNASLPGGRPKVDYTGADLSVAAGPQGLPPGVTQLRQDVPAEGPIAKLAPSAGSVLADTPMRTPGARAWGNASGEGPVFATIGNGITREDENRIRQVGGPLAVLAANQQADMGPITRANARAAGGLIGAQTEQALAQAGQARAAPGLEEKRLGVLDRETTARTELGKAELAGKLELGRGELTNRLRSIGLEERNVNRLDSLGQYEIEGKKLTAAHQQIVNDMTQKLMAAPDADSAITARQNLLVALGKDPKDFQIHVIPGEKIKNPDGTESQEAGALAIVGPSGKADIVQLPKKAPAPQYVKGERRQNPQTKEIREFNGKDWVKV